jgi:hypothetical protein
MWMDGLAQMLHGLSYVARESGNIQYAANKGSRHINFYCAVQGDGEDRWSDAFVNGHNGRVLFSKSVKESCDWGLQLLAEDNTQTQSAAAAGVASWR